MALGARGTSTRAHRKSYRNAFKKGKRTSYNRNEAAIFLVGDKDLQERLKVLRKASQRQVMRPALTAGLKPIRQKARDLAPSRSIARLIKSKVYTGGRRRNKRLIGMVYVAEHGERKVEWRGKQYDFSFVARIQEFGSYHQNIPAVAYMRNARETQAAAAVAAVTKKAKERILKLRDKLKFK